MSCLSPRTIRFSIFDRTPADNEIEGALEFTDDEIREAMINAARSYNSIPPMTLKVNPQCLDDATDIFIHGTIYWLYTGRVSQLRRNDPGVIPAGGITVDIIRKRIEYLDLMRKEHDVKFQAAARDHKVTRNLNQAFGEFE